LSQIYCSKISINPDSPGKTLKRGRLAIRRNIVHKSAHIAMLEEDYILAIPRLLTQRYTNHRCYQLPSNLALLATFETALLVVTLRLVIPFPNSRIGAAGNASLSTQ
jgi:hypothetical protein